MRLKYSNYFDSIYGSFIIWQTTNILTGKGRKQICESLLYNSFFLLNLKQKENAYLMFFEVIEQIRPTIFISFKKKITGKKSKIIIVPKIINHHQQYKHSLKSLRFLYLLRSNQEALSFKLFHECLNLYIRTDSLLLIKRNEIYQCAIKNKLNKHYR
jgi:ribosomal protein S7